MPIEGLRNVSGIRGSGIRWGRSSHASRTDERGFLLLEALVALAIVGLVAIALLGASTAQVRSAAKAAGLMVAGALAQDRLASIQLLDNPGLRDPPDSLLAGAFAPPFDEFTWTTEVQASDNEYDLFAVRVVVSGRGEVFPLETLVHRSAAVVTATAGAPGGQANQGAGPANAAGAGGRPSAQGGRQ
jgi:type II secretory pathway pseudopilin PulG